MMALPSSQAPRSVSEGLAARIGPQLSSLEVMLPAQTREKLLKQGGQNALRQAARKATEARQSLQAFDDLDRTARLLQEAADAHLDQLPLLRTFDEPVQLFVELATVELARDQQPQVDRALEAAARLDPSFDLDPQEVSPRLVRAARQARSKVAGDAILSASRARSFGKRLGVDVLLVLQPRPGPQEVLVEQYQISSGDRSATWLVKRNDISEVVAALGGSAPSQGTAQGEPEVEPERPEPERPETEPGGSEEAVVFSSPAPERQPTERTRRAWYRRWWVWTIIGVVVAGGAATGIVFGLQSQDGPEDLSLEVHGHW